MRGQYVQITKIRYLCFRFCTLAVHSRYSRMAGFGRREIEYMQALCINNIYIQSTTLCSEYRLFTVFGQNKRLNKQGQNVDKREVIDKYGKSKTDKQTCKTDRIKIITFRTHLEICLSKTTFFSISRRFRIQTIYCIWIE